LVFNHYLNENLDAECVKFCPLECKTETYDVSLIRNAFFYDFNKAYLNLAINYDTSSYLNYEESPSISIYNLVSNIGGAIGLLLGMSLLSIFEVLEVISINIYLIIKHKLFKLRKSKQSNV
jgi:hypothetical protein